MAFPARVGRKGGAALNQRHQPRHGTTGARIPVRDRLSYGIGNLAVGISIQVVGAYLVFFSTAILHLSGALVGVIVSIGILWDAVTDPVMGYVSDHTDLRGFGRRHAYILFGGIGMAAANAMLWAVRGDAGPGATFAALLALVLLIKTFMTIYTTPYTAFGAEMSTDYDERTAIQGIKTVFFLIGLAFVTVFGLYVIFAPTAEYPVGQLNPAAYPKLGYITSLLIAAFVLATFFGTRRYVPVLRETTWRMPAKDFHVKHMISDMVRIFRIRAYRSVAFTYMLNNTASAIVSNIGLHVFTYTFLLDSRQIAIVIGVQFAASLLSQPLWAWLARLLDKRDALRTAIGVSVVSSLLFALLVLLRGRFSEGIAAFLPFSLLSGIGLGGMFTLPLSMVSDVIDKDELQSGERLEGVFFGSLTLLYKFSQSITLVLVGGFLDLVGFDATLPSQPVATGTAMGLFFSAASALAFVGALFAASRYDQSRSQVLEIQEQLRSRSRSAE